MDPPSAALPLGEPQTLTAINCTNESHRAYSEGILGSLRITLVCWLMVCLIASCGGGSSGGNGETTQQPADTQTQDTTAPAQSEPEPEPAEDPMPEEVPVPVLLSPEANKEFNHFPRTVTFVWSAVSAPGTVTYNIEIQIDTGTWQPFESATGLQNPTYTMDSFGGDNPGRWRVWATSSTLGDSEKSEWREFSFST